MINYRFLYLVLIVIMTVLASTGCNNKATNPTSPTLVNDYDQPNNPPILRFARIIDIADQKVGGEILKVVYGRLGIAIELVDIPGKRALEESSAGRLDGEVHRNLHVGKEYPTLIPINPPINYIEPTVFTKQPQIVVNGWDSIKDYSIGIVRGVGSSERGTQGMKKVKVSGTQEQLMKMLEQDRVELVVTDLFSGKVELKKLKLEATIYPVSPHLQKIYINHYLHEKHRYLVPKVEKLLSEMQASGELEQLRAKFTQQLLEQY